MTAALRRRLPPQPPDTPELLDQLRLHDVRSSFREYRAYMRPELRWNWWTKTVAYRLQQFAQELHEGKRPRMAIMAPPQHGKSLTVEDFIAWIVGNHPKLKVIFASYSDDLGTQRNRNLQRIWANPKFAAAFPQLQTGGNGLIANQWLIEFADQTGTATSGSFTNTTVESGINGKELHLGVIDDPHKGRAEALSVAERTKVWGWFTDDWMPRMAKTSGQLIIMTRWHVDDLLGRYLEREKQVTIVSYPAIAEHDEPFRRAGEALFPSVKPLDHLLERKRLMTEASWQSEYQQHPIVIGGGVFPIDKLTHIQVFNKDYIKRSIRYIDKAATEGGDGAYTAMVLMHELKDGRFVISHVSRGHWGALEREQHIKTFATLDVQQYGYGYEIWVEQEPGSGGKESAEATIRNLAGFNAYADKVTGSKEVRAEPFAAQVQNNNVRLVAGTWNYEFLNEAEAWPNGRYRDQIDAAAGAFAKLTGGPVYDHSYRGWQ